MYNKGSTKYVPECEVPFDRSCRMQSESLSTVYFAMSSFDLVLCSSMQNDSRLTEMNEFHNYTGTTKEIWQIFVFLKIQGEDFFIFSHARKFCTSLDALSE